MAGKNLNLTDISSIKLHTTVIGEGEMTFNFYTIDETSINLRNVLADILRTDPENVSDEAMATGAMLDLDSIAGFDVAYDGDTKVQVSEQFFVSDNLSEYI